MLAPIYYLLFREDKSWGRGPSLELTEDEIAISYRKYKSHDVNDMQAIIDQKLTPGNDKKTKLDTV